MTLSFEPPEDTGESDIINYVIEYLKDGEGDWMKATNKFVNSTQHELIRRWEDGIYEFCIKAENGYGLGLPSDPSKAIIIKNDMCKY